MFPPEWGAMPNDDAPAAERGAYPNNPNDVAKSHDRHSLPAASCQRATSPFRAGPKRQCARAADRLYEAYTRLQLHLS